MSSLPKCATGLALFLAFIAPHATYAFDEKAQKPAAAVTTLKAGVARVEITDYDAGPVNDPSYVKALAISNGDTTAIIVTVDAVAIGGIGRIGNTYLPSVRRNCRSMALFPSMSSSTPAIVTASFELTQIS